MTMDWIEGLRTVGEDRVLEAADHDRLVDERVLRAPELPHLLDHARGRVVAGDGDTTRTSK